MVLPAESVITKCYTWQSATAWVWCKQPLEPAVAISKISHLLVIMVYMFVIGFGPDENVRA